MNIADIEYFFKKSSREENDAANKIRETVLKNISLIPSSFLEDEIFGFKWTTLSNAWQKALEDVAKRSEIQDYDTIQINHMGGRLFNHDYNAVYLKGTTPVKEAILEFKVGGQTIADSPQFLSLQAKYPFFEFTYDRFWYEQYLDKYIACDPGITEEKPSQDLYMKLVTNVKYEVHPFFQQLKERETVAKSEKAKVVNTSIEEYLSTYGMSMMVSVFEKKVKQSQTEKNYLLWCQNKFCIDGLSLEEMNEMKISRITKNTIEITSAGTLYKLLLRWRNHKGILNPAWQIRLKRKPVV